MLNLTPLQIIGIVLVVNGALVGSSAQLTDLFGPQAVKYIVSIASIGNTVLGGIVSFLSGQGSQIKNVLAMPGVERITVNSAASQTLAAIAVDPASNKIAPTPQALDRVTETAKGA